MTAEQVPALTAARNAAVRVCSIVICDDQPELRGAIDQMLARNPRFAVVGHAGDGAGCLEQVRHTRPDLLILDVNMPGGGPHVATAAKDIRPELHIVVFSGRQDGTVERAMLAAGADQYVVKTGRVRPLLQALETAYRQLAEAQQT
jgi:DNA-binding NarL/FixJ family response regulator